MPIPTNIESFISSYNDSLQKFESDINDSFTKIKKVNINVQATHVTTELNELDQLTKELTNKLADKSEFIDYENNKPLLVAAKHVADAVSKLVTAINFESNIPPGNTAKLTEKFEQISKNRIIDTRKLKEQREQFEIDNISGNTKRLIQYFNNLNKLQEKFNISKEAFAEEASIKNQEKFFNVTKELVDTFSNESLNETRKLIDQFEQKTQSKSLEVTQDITGVPEFDNAGKLIEQSQLENNQDITIQAYNIVNNIKEFISIAGKDFEESIKNNNESDKLSEELKNKKNLEEGMDYSSKLDAIKKKSNEELEELKKRNNNLSQELADLKEKINLLINNVERSCHSSYKQDQATQAVNLNKEQEKEIVNPDSDIGVIKDTKSIASASSDIKPSTLTSTKESVEDRKNVNYKINFPIKEEDEAKIAETLKKIIEKNGKETPISIKLYDIKITRPVGFISRHGMSSQKYIEKKIKDKIWDMAQERGLKVDNYTPSNKRLLKKYDISSEKEQSTIPTPTTLRPR